jgi:hypothetical protein
MQVVCSVCCQLTNLIMCTRNEICKKLVKKTPKKANKLLWIAIPLMIIGLVVVIIGLIQGYDTNSTWVIGIVIMSGGWILFKITPKKN